MKEEEEHKDIIPEKQWEDLLDVLTSNKGIALIMGETDSGKSTLARYLTERLLNRGITVSLVDSDIGQSSLCFPGSISMKIFNDEGDFKRFRFERMSFVGTANPALVIPMIIETSGRMVDLCRKTSDITLVDTTGLVHGRIGKTLKSGKIKRIRPDHIIAICKGKELEYVLGSLSEFNIYRIRKAANIKRRTRAVRARYRRRRLQDYFSRASLFRHVADEKSALFFYRSRPLRPEDSVPEGTIVGLNSGKDTIGLGMVLLHNAGAVTFVSPIKSTKRINKVILGDITI